jgi:hypothetical protein
MIIITLAYTKPISFSVSKSDDHPSITIHPFMYFRKEVENLVIIIIPWKDLAKI